MVREAPTEVPAVVAAPPPDNATLALWVWLSAEAVFFASLIGTYLLLHTQTNHGITPRQAFDLPLTFLGTIILLSSSMTMALGYAQIQRGNVAGLRRWLIVTAILGLGFLAFQGVEFTHFYSIGLTLKSSPFGSAFFTLTGFHGLHVFFGVFWIVSLLAYSFRPEFRAEAVTKTQVLGLYWHFVDVVWVVIFSLVYLLGKVG
jgi:cytochrome c oxidase subunit 3